MKSDQRLQPRQHTRLSRVIAGDKSPARALRLPLGTGKACRRQNNEDIQPLLSGGHWAGELSKRCHDDDGAQANVLRELWLMKTVVKTYANITAISRMPTGTRNLAPRGTTRRDSNCALTDGAGMPRDA